MRKNPVEFYRRVSLQSLTARLTDRRSLLRPWQPPFSWFFVGHPVDLERILFSSYVNFVKGELNRPFKRMLGNGLLTSDGDLWRRQRRILQPIFTKDRVQEARPEIDATCRDMLERWRRATFSGNAHAIDLAEEFATLTMDLVWRFFLGRSLSIDQLNTINGHMHTALEYVTKCSFTPRIRPEWLATPNDRRFYRAMDSMDAILATELDETPTTNFLKLLREGRDRETGQTMTALMARDEIITVLHAGQNTLASALTWTFIMLSRHSEWRLAVEEEAAREKAASSVDEMLETVIGRTLLESMRLFPPAWGGVRENKAADTLGGVGVPPGSLIVFSQFATHRHPELWPNPEVFEPNRFAEPHSFMRGCYRYFPFGAGPRRCIGEHFAILAAYIVIRAITREFRVNIDPSWPNRYHPLLDLEPRRPVMAKVVERRYG